MEALSWPRDERWAPGAHVTPSSPQLVFPPLLVRGPPENNLWVPPASPSKCDPAFVHRAAEEGEREDLSFTALPSPQKSQPELKVIKEVKPGWNRKQTRVGEVLGSHPPKMYQSEL